MHVSYHHAALAIGRGTISALAITDLMPCPLRRRVTGTMAAGLFVLFVVAAPAHGQASSRPCPPVSERTSWLGTCRTAAEPLGGLPRQPIFWHLDVHTSRAAADAAKGPGGTVVESLGRVWLFTIAEAGWRPSGGQRVAEIGPLPVEADVSYTAVYMQSIFAPGTTTPIHTHSGPEGRGAHSS